MTKRASFLTTRGVIHPDYVDTSLPTMIDAGRDLEAFHRVRFNFSLLVHKVLDLSLKVRGTNYTDIISLHHEVLVNQPLIMLIFAAARTKRISRSSSAVNRS